MRQAELLVYGYDAVENTKDEDPTGLLNEGFRYRDLETGVFLTADPAGFVDGPNLYTYVKQNPWTSFDPEGLATDTPPPPPPPPPKPNFFKRMWQTAQHTFDGTLGQHKNDIKPEAQSAKTANQTQQGHIESQQTNGDWQTGIHAAVFASNNDPKNNGQANAATGKPMGSDEMGVALPSKNADGRQLEIQSTQTIKTKGGATFDFTTDVITSVKDRGPHYTDNPYWETNERPKAEIRGNLYLADPKANAQFKHDKNRAGIDLSVGTAKALNIPVGVVKTKNGPEWQTQGHDPVVNWRFIDNK